MRALVVYESMFGNTETIARAIGEGLASGIEVDVVEAAHAPVALDDVALLVAGGPTHAFGLTRESTREDAKRRAGGAVVSQGIGIREWLEQLHRPSTPIPAAAFDTRIDKPRVPGSAAKAAGKRLRRLGFTLLAAPADFYVSDVEGPLLADEVERARQWGESLAAALAHPSLSATRG